MDRLELLQEMVAVAGRAVLAVITDVAALEALVEHMAAAALGRGAAVLRDIVAAAVEQSVLSGPEQPVLFLLLAPAIFN